MVAGTLTDKLNSEGLLFVPERVLQGREVLRNGVHVEQVSVQWMGLQDKEAIWLDVEEMRKQFPDFSLAVKAVLRRAATDTPNL